MNVFGILIAIAYLVVLFFLFFKKKRTLLYLLVYISMIVTSIPLFNNFICLGIDTSVHLGRIAALSDTLRNGYFPPRILTWVRNSYGWAAGVMYPQLFLYIPAIIGLIKPMDSQSIIYCISNSFLLLVNIFSLELMFYVLLKIYKKESIAIIGCILTCFMYHRLNSMYVIGQYGELLGMACTPLYILGLYYIFNGDYKKWYVLTIACTLLVGSHLITVLLLGILTIFVMLICIKKILRFETFVALLKSYIFALLINLYFFVPLLDYLKEEDLVTTPMQITNVNNLSLLSSISLRDFTLGLLVVVLFLIAIILFFILYRKQKNCVEYKTSLIIFAIAVIAFLFCTCPLVMPNLNKIEPIRKLLSNMQYARRWFGPISVCTIMSVSYLIGSVIEKKAKLGIVAILIITVVISLPTIKSCIIDYMNQGYWSNIIANMNWSDYSYKDTSIDYEKVINNSAIPTGNIEINRLKKKGLNVVFEYVTNGKGLLKQKEVTIPLLYYPGYISKDEKGKVLEIYRNKDNLITIKLEKNSGTIETDFYGLPHWKYFDLISAFSLIFFILLMINTKIPIFRKLIKK